MSGSAASRCAMSRAGAGSMLALFTLWLSACSLSTPPARPELLERALPTTSVIPADWQQAGSAAGAVGDNWLASFADPQLEALVSEALANNPDLRQSASMVLAVAQRVELANASMLPQIGGQLGETRTRDFDGSSTVDAHQSNVMLSWELDIWGRLRAQKGAAQANYAAAALDYAFARQSLAATTAKSWFVAVQASRLLALSEQAVAIYGELLNVSQIRQRAGKVSEFDVIQAQAAFDGAQANLQDAQNSLAGSKRNLELLLGRYPAAEIALSAQSATLPIAVSGSVPLSLLSRRPDLLAAEQQVRSAFRTLEASKLALRPDFSFKLEVGRFSDNVISLLDLNPWMGHAAIGMQIPIYEGGALIAQINIADAQEQAAVAGYGSVVLSAFNEVESSLANEYHLSRSLVYVDQGVFSLAQAVALAKDRYQAGASDMQSVLQLQTSELNGQVDAINLRYSLLANRVGLNLALGGSFDNQPVVPAALLSTLNQ